MSMKNVRAREFGEVLRVVIADTGMNSRAIAEMLDWEERKLVDLINGDAGVSERDLALLLGVCRTPAEDRDRLLAVLPHLGRRGWWQEHGACAPIRQRTLAEHERMARKLVSWQLSHLHTLMQLQEYTRAVVRAGANVPESEVDARVEARTARQVVLRLGLQCVFYVHESVLLAPVGGHEVMEAQLQHLQRLARRPHVEVRVVPLAAGAHAGLAGAFDLLTFERYDPVVFVENENSSLVVEEPAAVAAYQRVVEALDGVALDREESLGSIGQLLA
ncbi:hypothetical protein BBK82_28665 [Lentzea guizhouensis]|uniref:DUF5753 domain-containing protein n=2 Tax=Lentzea guizhouensis TaxID=1586287 RepID=A0A1B2HNV8_9PSEU|nr:hypothetical protein BBK82_28665 [Lentzea guizhouensis]